MNFDSSAIEKLLTLSDSELWTTLRTLASMNNVSLPSTTPSVQEMQKLRALFKNGGGLSAEKAKEIINNYKRETH